MGFRYASLGMLLGTCAFFGRSFIINDGRHLAVVDLILRRLASGLRIRWLCLQVHKASRGLLWWHKYLSVKNLLIFDLSFWDDSVVVPVNHQVAHLASYWWNLLQSSISWESWDFLDRVSWCSQAPSLPKRCHSILCMSISWRFSSVLKMLCLDFTVTWSVDLAT